MDCRKGTREHVPDTAKRAKVEALCCVGLTQDQIAEYMQIDPETLRKHYPDELRTAKRDKLCKVAALAYTRAMEGNDKMIDLILRTQARWTNPQPVQEIVHTTKAALTEHVKSRGLDVLRETSEGDNADAE